jgi:hypothetical protein
LAVVATVNSEILVGREDDGIGKRFGHANEASIGEAHGNVGIFLDQLRDWLHVLSKSEDDAQSAASKQCAESGGTKLSEKVVSLGQNGFARGPGRRHFGGFRHGPLVVGVATAKQRYNKSGVNEDVSGHNPWRANISSSAHLGRSVGHPPIR